MSKTGFQKLKPKEPAGYTTANINSDLHAEIRAEAERNNQSFSAQVREYRNKSIKLEEDLVNARIEIKALKERSKN